MQEPLLCAGSFKREQTGPEMMTRDTQHPVKSLSPEVRRQMGSDSMRRFVRSLPPFAVKPDVPAHLRDLLDQLDRAEKKTRARSGKNNGHS
ncbi:hypothetical protein [Mesorhizobium sp. WSM2239]|jgi:hypothetical protein|uniref:Anti-sigma factor NepR domain-containing protein n=2 Tax=unclassified Mesorhizobium TaxID=325217 RepID=A0AAU8D8Z9_9HYPH